MNLETLHGPGLWVPLAAARRIHAVCTKVNKRLTDKDKQEHRNHYRNIDVTNSAANNNNNNAAGSRPTSGSRHGDDVLSDHDPDHPDPIHAARAPSEASTAVTAVVKNKADARREYDAEVIRQKKAAREQAELVRLGKVRKKTDALKQHSEELEQRIAQIRRRCAREDAESSPEFDEITGILYSSYQRRRAGDAAAHTDKDVGATTQEGTHSETARASTADGALSPAARRSNPHTAALDAASGGSPSRVLRALRASASSASFSATTSGANLHNEGSPTRAVHPEYHQPTSFCCAKHAAAVLSNREAYIAQRKVQRALELRVLLDRIPTAICGYVTSHSLRAVAEMYLKSYHSLPPRADDPTLIMQSVEYCRLGLEEQRARVLCVRPREVRDENLNSVLPVVWYCPTRFIEGFVDLLEQLDRERIDTDPPAAY
jgi:hypothetical protein